MTLREYLDRAGQRPFRYGRHDCCTVAAAWVRRATGRDVLQGQTYASLADGLRRMQGAGFQSHDQIFAAALPRRAKLMLRAGDIAVMPGRKLLALGIVLPGGERVWCFGPEGVGSVSLTDVDYGFEVSR